MYALRTHNLITSAMDENYDKLVLLVPVFLFLAVLLFFALLWCMISSCMGTPIRRAFSNLWEYVLLSSRSGGLASRPRGGFGEQEIWEMELRRRTG